MRNYDTEYLSFVRGPDSASGKTGTWFIHSMSYGNILGSISWYGPWRQYVFVPEADTLFNIGCLNDIAGFIQNLMDERRVQRAATNIAAG